MHLALSTDNIEASIKDYTARLAKAPCSLISGEYALWRTETLNFSIRYDLDAPPGSLRHLGWEDSGAVEFTQDRDTNGILWEKFNASHQADEINTLWPEAEYKPTD